MPFDLINVLGPFWVILQPLNLSKFVFTYVSSASETSIKVTKVL